MLVIIIGIVWQAVILLFGILSILAAVQKNRKQAVFDIIVAVVSFLITLFAIHLPEPEIGRADDYSVLEISAEKLLTIEYKVQMDGENTWKRYKEPLTLEHSAVVKARTRLFILSSGVIEKDVFVEENGLISFGGADSPKETLKSIKAEYTYREPQGSTAGNHYVGCELSKEDILVTGVDLRGNIQNVTDFTFSPEILDAGRNDIQVTYELAKGKTLTTHLYINGTAPKLLSISARYNGRTLFAGSELTNDDFEVLGKYEDGIEQSLSSYAMSISKVKLGKNEITITKDGLSTSLEVEAVDRDSITENEKEPNNDISTSNDIEANVKYTGCLRNEDDVDYYKLVLDKKGKIVLHFKHPKIDYGSELWRVRLLGDDESEKINMSVSGAEVESVSNAIRVTPGTYYIKIECGNFSAEKYTFIVDFHSEGKYYETEPNDDSASQANAIKINKTYTGNLSDGGDQDFFKFVLKEKRKVRLKFSHAKTDYNSILWRVALLGDSEGELTAIESTGQNAHMYSDYVRLPAGIYYVRITSFDNWIDSDYKVIVEANKESDQTENEENDDYGSATSISLGSSIKGNIQSSEDIDFYKIVLNRKTNLKVQFSHDLIDNTNLFWNVMLYSEDSGEGLKNDDEQSSWGISGTSQNNVSTWSRLSAGTYYMKISSNWDYTNIDYTLRASGY